MSAGSSSPAITVPGINIANTTGSFTVTGDGSASGSGGTIQNIGGSSTDGVSLDDAAGVSLSYMKFAHIGLFGIYVAADGSGVSGLRANFDGFNDITSSAVDSKAKNSSQITDVITNGTFTTDNPSNGTASWNDNIALTGGDTSVTKYTITGNTLTHIGLSDIIANLGDGTTPGTGQGELMEGTVSGNHIGNSAEYSGSAQGEGIWVDGNGNTTTGGGHSIALVTNNAVDGTADNGIEVSNGDGAPAMDATVTNNNINIASDSNTFADVFVYDGKTGTDSDTTCAQVSGNTEPDAGDSISTVVEQGYSGDPDHFNLVGVGTGASDSSVRSYLDSNNNETGGTSIAGGSFDVTSSPTQCAQPPSGPTSRKRTVLLHSKTTRAASTAARHATVRSAALHHSARRADAPITSGTPITIGTIPAGHSITLTFSATVNSEISNPAGATSIENKGAIDASNASETDVSATNALALFASSTQVVSSDLGSSIYGDSVTFTATVTAATGTGTPSGTVTFYDGDPSTSGVQIGTPQTLVSGSAGVSTSGLLAGSHTIYAVYSGDDRFNGGFGVVGQDVSQAGSSTSLQLTTGTNPSRFGDSLTFTSTVTSSAGTPTGIVRFYDGDPSNGGTQIGTDQTLSGGTAAVSTSTLSVGPHTIYAVYQGDTNFQSSQDSLGQQVNSAITGTQTAVTLTTGTNPSTYEDSLQFTATVSPVASSQFTPSGNVEFWDGTPNAGGSTDLGTRIINGSQQATFTTSGLSGGPHDIFAVYGGDTNFDGSQGDVTQTVNAASSTTTVSLTNGNNPSRLGDSLTFTATVTSGAGTPGGTVKFYDGDPSNGGTQIGTDQTLSGGTAAVRTSTLSVGPHTIYAVYQGDTNFQSSQDSLGQQVNSAVTGTQTAVTLTTGVDPSTYGDSLEFTATISPVASSQYTPTGNVEFWDGNPSDLSSTDLGGKPLNGSLQATFTTSGLSGGPHDIFAVYAGDTNFDGSQGDVTQTVNPASTTTTVSLTNGNNPSRLGDSLTFTATVTSGAGTPGGTVQFFDGDPATTGTQIGSDQSLSSGSASVTTTTLSLGSRTVYAVYEGNSDFQTSQGTVGQQVNPATVASQTSVTLTSGNNPSKYGDSLTFTASVSPAASSSYTPSGKVEFWDGNPGNPGSTDLGSRTLDNNGNTTYSTSALTDGTHDIFAVYGGDSNFLGSQGDVRQTVNPYSVKTHVSLTSGANPSAYGDSLTFTASLIAARLNPQPPSGSIQFWDGNPTSGGKYMGSRSLADSSNVSRSAAKASITVSSLLPGIHQIFAVYKGDTNYGKSQNWTIQSVILANIWFRTNRGTYTTPAQAPTGANGLQVTVKFNQTPTCSMGYTHPEFHVRWLSHGQTTGVPELAPCKAGMNKITNEIALSWNTSGVIDKAAWEYNSTVLARIAGRLTTTNGLHLHLCKAIIPLCTTPDQNNFGQVWWTRNGKPLKQLTPSLGSNRLVLKVQPQMPASPYAIRDITPINHQAVTNHTITTHTSSSGYQGSAGAQRPRPYARAQGAR